MSDRNREKLATGGGAVLSVRFHLNDVTMVITENYMVGRHRRLRRNTANDGCMHPIPMAGLNDEGDKSQAPLKFLGGELSDPLFVVNISN